LHIKRSETGLGATKTCTEFLGRLAQLLLRMILTAAELRPLTLWALQGNPVQEGFVSQYTAPVLLASQHA